MSLDSRYIKPYKNLALELSRPYSYTRNIKFKLTFSVTQINIPPSAYMILNFNFLELFNDKDIGSPLNCKMSLYREKIGASFDPLIDLDSEIDNLNINYISQCSSAPNPPFYYFQLNHTLSFLQLYQLSFQMNAEMVKFSTGLSISFVSNINLLDSNYIYCSNLLYGILLIQDLPDTYHNISFKSQKKYFSDAFYQIINVALSQTLLTYSQALMSLKDISISSFNSMIENSVFSGIEFFDNHVYPDNIMNFPGFFGNLVLEIFLNETANSFLLWELNVPIGWNLEESNCISTNFFKNGKINIAIAHTKCTIEKNQMIKFYNIENIEANTWIRINITSVRNPIIPMNGTAKFNIFNEKIREIQYQNRYLSGLEVQQQKNNNLKVEFYSTDSSFTGNLNLFANRTQRLAIKISIPYYDLIGETKIVIQQNNINIDYGFSLGTCVIKNSEDALIPITDARKIQCIIEKSKITLKNIGRIKANKYFEIYILNKNEGTSGFLSFQIDIYGIDLTQQSFANISSYSYNKTINLTLDTSLLIQDIFYQINNNNSQVFDISEVHSADKPIFIVNFTFTKTIKKNNIGDRVILLLNKWISISVQDLNCEIDSKIISCTHQNNYEDISVISLNIDNFALNLFNNHSHILKISGLSYTRICFNSYLFAFEYFLAYKSINDSIILSMKTAHINPILKETAAEDQILLIGQGIKPQVFYSFLKVKFSSSIIHHFLENLKPNSLLVRIYHQNLNNTHYKNFVSADVTTNSHINAEFIKGVNESSLDYLDWDFYELSNISINNLNDYAEITLEMTFSPPIFNIDYYFTTTIYKIPILYDLFQKKIQTNTKFIKPDKLILDWNASRILNKGKLILRQPIFFSFSLNLSSEIIAPLILRHSGYLVFIFPWLILNDNILPLNCSFLKKSIFFSINVKKILDKFSKNSALLMKLDDLDIYNDYFEPLENSIICSNLMPPEGLNFKEADGLVLDSQGVIISRNSMKFKSEDFDSGLFF